MVPIRSARSSRPPSFIGRPGRTIPRILTMVRAGPMKALPRCTHSEHPSALWTVTSNISRPRASTLKQRFPLKIGIGAIRAAPTDGKLHVGTQSINDHYETTHLRRLGCFDGFAGRVTKENNRRQ